MHSLKASDSPLHTCPKALSIDTLLVRSLNFRFFSPIEDRTLTTLSPIVILQWNLCSVWHVILLLSQSFLSLPVDKVSQTGVNGKLLQEAKVEHPDFA